MRQLERWLAYKEEKRHLRRLWAEKRPFDWLPIALLACMAAGGTFWVLLLSWLLSK